MSAGRYRHRVRVQRVNEAAVQMAAGEIDKTIDANWETFAERFMEVTPQSGGETAGTQVQGFLLHKVKARADSVTRMITPRHRLLFGTRKLNIASALIVGEQNREVLFKCTEVVGEE